MTLYHITRKNNVPRILIEGLLPSRSKGLTARTPKHNKVFLTNDIDKIIKYMGGSSWETNIAILGVKCTDAKPAIYTHTGIQVESDFEFIIDKVLPNQIINVEYR